MWDIWAGACDFGIYRSSEQRRLQRVCVNEQTSETSLLPYTQSIVDLKIFARILFSQIALRDIVVM